MDPRRWEMFTHILVPLDGSEFSEHAIEPAGSLAEKYGARIRLLSAMVQFPASRLQVPMLDQRSEARGREYLEEAHAERIAEVAGDSHADLIVMSTHGTTGPRHTLGSTAWKILQDAPCPVLLIVAHRAMAKG
jgi:nucleotide-binding universal stress UspA family protein